MDLAEKLETVKVDSVLSLSGYSELKYIVEPLAPVIIATMHITNLDVEAVAVVSSRANIHGIFTGYDFINVVKEHRDNPWRALYNTPCGVACSRAIEIKHDDTLASLLKSMLMSRRGYAVVTKNEEAISVIGTLGIAKFFHKTDFLKDLKEITMKKVATRYELVRGEPDMLIHELINIMINTYTRRVLIQGEKPKIITDRDIAKYLLDKQTIIQFRDNPRRVLDREIREILNHCGEPAVLNSDTEVNTVLETLLKNETTTVISDDMKYITTPWDITVGLYRSINRLEMRNK